MWKPLAAILCAAVAVADTAQGPALQISRQARALHPGEVVRFSVRAPAPIDMVSGEAFGRPIAFYPAEAPGEWEALVGIGLDVKPGPHHVRIEAMMSRATSTLQVLPKTFAVRRLTVPPGFATPPAHELERIAQETAQVDRIFKTVTAERFWRGSFEPPVPGAAVSSFGRHSIVNGAPRSRHLGGDFRARRGEPVLAPNAGRIVLVASHYFAGNLVILDHGAGVYSYFAHLDSASVTTGDMLRTGDVLGAAGETGRVTGPHLHWAVSVGGTRVDPLSLIAATSKTRPPP